MSIPSHQAPMDIVSLTQRLLHDAIAQKASDIHIEPSGSHCKVRIRVDGVLNEMACYPSDWAKQIGTRLKIIAKLNIAEQRIPQDGQLTIQGQNMRISTIPVRDGEKIVLRILDNDQSILTLDELGLTADEEAIYRTQLQAPQGLILVTGPTGSGKTVTLYSGLQTINTCERNISTVEDPVEMPIDGINQTQINAKIGLQFETMLRALLRQDPDVLMIGEIRDCETAEIAIQSAQTGHLVLSTLHTNSSAEAIIRLKQMGIPSYLLASSVQLIIAQRLVRKLCPHCRRPAETAIALTSNDPIADHYLAVGCEQCHQGYLGRTALYEFLPITADIKSMLYENQHLSYHALMRDIERSMHSTLQHAADRAVRSGLTSFNEVYRVLGQRAFQSEGRS